MEKKLKAELDQAQADIFDMQCKYERVCSKIVSFVLSKS